MTRMRNYQKMQVCGMFLYRLDRLKTVLPLEARAQTVGAQDLGRFPCRIPLRTLNYRLQDHQADPDALDHPCDPALLALNAVRSPRGIHVFIHIIA